MPPKDTGPPKETAPDVRQLDRESLAKHEFPGGRKSTFRVFFAPEVHEQIWQHSAAQTSVEICGVLVGQWGQDEAGPFVTISASIRGQDAANKFAEVTFTHQTWAIINAEMDSKFSDKSIVGWYHTHPDFGIFLSDRDRFIQENFFSAPGQIALVVDPIRKIEGVFIWSEGKSVLAPHYWVGDDVRAAPSGPAQGESASHDGAAPGQASSEPPQPLIPPIMMRALERSVMYVLVFLVGYLAAGRLNDWMLRRTEHAATAFSFFQLGVRPGLDSYLRDMQVETTTATGLCQGLSQQHLALLTKDKAAAEDVEKARENWTKLVEQLNRLDKQLDATLHDYCLDAEEQAMLAHLLESQSRRTESPPPKETPSRSQPATGKPSDAKPSGAKPSDAKPSDAKPSNAAGDDKTKAEPPADTKPAAPSPPASFP